ncbi:MAG TPA: hypothetical protein VKR53_03620, partial [Puia sp.]|nr:hypothetical protein [Puia sp.]
PISFFESIHPQEKIDHYGQNNFCSLYTNGVRTNPNINFSIANDFYYEIHRGISKILETNNFKEYSGWLFLYVHFDQQGLLRNKNVLLYQENETLKRELMNFLDGLNAQKPLVINNHNTDYSKFYVVLIENNQLVIPEELLLNNLPMNKR